MSVIPQPLKISEIRSMCEAAGANLEDFEKVLTIEDVAYPMIMEAQRENAGSKNSS